MKKAQEILFGFKWGTKQRIDALRAAGGGCLLCITEKKARWVAERFGGKYEAVECHKGRHAERLWFEDGTSVPIPKIPEYHHWVRFDGLDHEKKDSSEVKEEK